MSYPYTEIVITVRESESSQLIAVLSSHELGSLISMTYCLVNTEGPQSEEWREQLRYLINRVTSRAPNQALSA